MRGRGGKGRGVDREGPKGRGHTSHFVLMCRAQRDQRMKKRPLSEQEED